jgi:lysophospholipase L1-like esterase
VIASAHPAQRAPASPVDTSVAPAEGAASAGEAKPEPAPAPAPLPKDTLVLHVGDSFADSLGAPLGRRLVQAGLRSVLESKTPSYIPVWAHQPDLKSLVARHNPDLVLITLGGNEFEIPNPADRIPAVKRIVSATGGRPCVWITPPRWKPDTGILSVLREHATPCRFLDSDSIVHDLPRARDGIHPSEAGRELWADAVFAWLSQAREPSGSAPWSLRP